MLQRIFMVEMNKEMTAVTQNVVDLFESIKSVNVEIREMKYQSVYNINKEIDINKLGGCISSVFTIESSNFDKGINNISEIKLHNKNEII